MPRFRSPPALPPRRRRGAGRGPVIHRSRVDNYLAPVRTRSLPDLLATQPANGICAGNRGWGRQGLGGHVPWHRTAVRRICTVSSTSLVHSPLHSLDLAGAGVIGACSHAGPGCREVPRARLRSAIRAWIIPGAAAGLDWEDPRESHPILQVMTGWPSLARSRPCARGGPTSPAAVWPSSSRPSARSGLVR